MAFSFRNMMTSEEREKFDQGQAYLERERGKLYRLLPLELAEYAQRCLDNSEGPRKHDQYAPVYDNAMWHLVIPEMIRRLELIESMFTELRSIKPCCCAACPGGEDTSDAIAERLLGKLCQIPLKKADTPL